jgi:hypothetical protein
MLSEDAEVRAPDDTLVLAPELREGTEPEPLVLRDDPEPEGLTGVPVEFEEGDPPLPNPAIGEETLLVWLPCGKGIATVTPLTLGSPP